MLLDLITDIDSPSGYSSFARDFGRALYNAGVEIKVTPHKHDKTNIPLDEFWNVHLKEFIADDRKPDIRMHIETPEFFQIFNDVMNIGFTFWETDRIPGVVRPGEPSVRPNFNWVSQMNLMDEMWTSANSASLAFRNSGVKSKIRVIGVPMEFIDSDDELPIVGTSIDESGNPIPKKERRIVIGSVAQFNYRKNIEDLIIAVCSEFRSHEVVLLLKTYGASQNDPKQEEAIKNRVIGLKNAVGWKDIPQVVLVQNTLSDLQMRQLYNSMDMFVSCTRGEGFGIPMAQAMGSGIPVICTGWSSMTDFIEHEQTGWLIKYQMEPVHGMPFIPWYRPDQKWAKINMVDLMAKMRKVYNGIKNDDPEIREVSRRGAKRIRELYGAEHIGQIGRHYLEEALKDYRSRMGTR